VTAVGSAEQALAHTPLLLPHLIINDLKMNGMDGMTLFNQTHTHNPSLPVLILTAQGTVGMIVRCGCPDMHSRPSLKIGECLIVAGSPVFAISGDG